MKWITRKNVKVDRVACPWLIRRFVDKDEPSLNGLRRWDSRTKND
ncbi:MAG: chromate resistance protein ChrB domain-containing protein [Candidatus Angelobacter sp.]